MNGTKLDVINTAVGTGSDTEITYDEPVISFIIKTRNGNAFQWRATNNASDFFSFDSGEKMESKVLLSGAGYTGPSLGFIRSVGSSDTVEVLVSFLGAIK